MTSFCNVVVAVILKVLLFANNSCTTIPSKSFLSLPSVLLFAYLSVCLKGCSESLVSLNIVSASAYQLPFVLAVSSVTDKATTPRASSLSAPSGRSKKILTSSDNSYNRISVDDAVEEEMLLTLNPRPPIVYTIAGSDSGGGAGIQADLHAIHAMQCHGCSAITCLTAQNSVGVTDVHTPPASFLKTQLDALKDDLPPRAIKIGMIGSPEIAQTVATFLKEMKQRAIDNHQEPPFVILDPVMISTSGHALITDETKNILMKEVFPHCHILTPNKFEAENLLGRTLTSPKEVEEGAKEFIDQMNVQAVLIKGGHSLLEGRPETVEDENEPSLDVNATLGFAQDYFLSKKNDDNNADNGNSKSKERRLCDGQYGVWLRSPRYDTENTHGTGCTLSSAIASALALGHQQREMAATSDGSNGDDNFLRVTGATKAIELVDACCLAKAYVTAGIAQSVALGKGPGPVVHTTFPSTYAHFPSITLDPVTTTANPPDSSTSTSSRFRPVVAWTPHSGENGDAGSTTLGRVLPIVDNVEWVKKLCNIPGVTDIQLRIKGMTDPNDISDCIKESQQACSEKDVRLWINDYWREAIKHKCFGVHLGQEDLAQCAIDGGLESMQEHNMALGISTHSFAELAVAFGIRPSYISLGPIFGTISKEVAFAPQRLLTLRQWHKLKPPNVPLVVIGGINDELAAMRVKVCGADCAAVIGAVIKADDPAKAITTLNEAMS